MGELRSSDAAQERAAQHQPIMYAIRLGCVLMATVAVGACASIKTPDRLYSIEEESASIRNGVDDIAVDFKKLSKKDQRRARNELIAARKYSIDMQYTKYEADLTREVQLADFGAKAANIALGTTAELVPVTHTKDLLNGIALGTTNLDGAYSDKVLRTKLIENVQSAMRTARHERAAVIYANMRCSIKTYPVAMALSDLEAYYRAGTFHAGLIKLSQIVTEKETNTAAGAEAQKSGNTDAQAKLAAMAAEANVKAAAALTPAGDFVVVTPNGQKKVRGAHKCSPKDEAD